MQTRPLANQFAQISAPATASLLAPGHVYNPATRSGIELIFIPQVAATGDVTFASNPAPASVETPEPEPGLEGETKMELLPKVTTRLWQAGQLLAATDLPVARLLAEIGQLEQMATIPGGEYEARIRWHFWHELWFARVFPRVSDWWFGSAWTQLVRLSAPVATLDDGATVTGYMQFIDEEHPAMPWTITDQAGATLSGKPLIATPLPPFEVSPLNLPLRLALAELVVKLIQGDIGANQWQLVTSLVARDRLEEVLSAVPPQPQLEAELSGKATGTGEVKFSSNSGSSLAQTQAQSRRERDWQLDDPRLEEASLREAFCIMQGLRKP